MRYFALKIAVVRLGGLGQAARVLRQPATAVQGWVTASRRTKPPGEVLQDLALRSGVALEDLQGYFENLQAYREREGFRRRRRP